MVRFFRFFFIFYLLVSGPVYAYDFNSLTLEKAIEIAKTNNYELLYLSEEVRAKKYSKGAYTANYFPQVNFHVIFPFLGRASAFQVDQLIFDFGKLNQRINAGKYNIKAMEYQNAHSSDAIINNLTQKFYQILKLQNSMAMIKRTIATNQNLLDQAEAFLDTGRVSAMQVTRRDLELGESELLLVQAKGAMLKLEEDLFNLLGIEKPSGVTYISDIQYEKIDLNPELIINSNLNYLNTVKAAEMRILALKSTISALKRDFFPNLVARAAYRFEGKGVPDSDKDNDLVGGLGLTWQVFSGGRTYNQIQEHKATLNALTAKVNLLKREASTKIRLGIIDANTEYYKIGIRQKAVGAAQTYYEYTKTKYDTGEKSQIEFLEAANLLQKQEVEYENSIYNYKIKIARLEKLAGLVITE